MFNNLGVVSPLWFTEHKHMYICLFTGFKCCSSQWPLVNNICCVCINLHSFGNALGNILRGTTKCSTSQRAPVSSNTVESVCLHLHTNVTFHLPKGCGRFYFHHSDALDKPFFPVWRQAYDVQWESERKLYASGPFCVFLLLNCHRYSVIFVSEMELISFVYISLKREAVHCLKRLTWNHWEGLDGWILFWWRNY